jgi:hypothetical protein
MQSEAIAQRAATVNPTQNQIQGKIQARTEAQMPVEFIELGLGLELLLETHPVFADAVRAAILPLDGEFLFELPHGDEPGGKGRIAALRLPYAGSKEPRLVFAILGDDGLETRVEAADGQPAHLKSFAQSFVDVLEKIGTH